MDADHLLAEALGHLQCATQQLLRADDPTGASLLTGVWCLELQELFAEHGVHETAPTPKVAPRDALRAAHTATLAAPGPIAGLLAASIAAVLDEVG